MNRCKWCDLNDPVYVKYHDCEWGQQNFDEGYLFEMLLLESFQAGLSWKCVLDKRENFRAAFDGFDPEKIAAYGNEKFAELYENKGIVRNKLKIKAAASNAKIFLEIQREFGSFYNYLTRFTGTQTMYEIGKTVNDVSDALSRDLKKRGMKFVGSTIIYSYLQAVGFIYSHGSECDLFKDK